MNSAYIMGRLYAYLGKIDDKLNSPTKVAAAQLNPMHGMAKAHAGLHLTTEQSAYVAKLLEYVDIEDTLVGLEAQGHWILGYYNEISNAPLPGQRSLRQLREEAGMTQREVSKQLDVTPSQYNQWETGTASIPEKHKPALSKILGVIPEAL